MAAQLTARSSRSLTNLAGPSGQQDTCQPCARERVPISRIKGRRWLQQQQQQHAQMAGTALHASMRMNDLSRQFKDARKSIEEDSQVASLMAGLRGSNIDDSDFADTNVVMRLVEVKNEGDEQLPQVYEPAAIADYWSRRPVSVATRSAQLLSISWNFLSGLGWDLLRGNYHKNEVKQAIDLWNIATSLGPAYIKLGQALSICPGLLSPTAMVELQKLCDKVYKGKLKTGEDVAVKVQRPYDLETVTIDLFVIRRIFVFLRRFPAIKTDLVALLDEWATRFFEELDYLKEGQNGMEFAESMKKDLPQVVVPSTFFEYTSRRVLTTAWLSGEKLSQSTADDVGSLVNIGVICYLKQLLDTGLFHADPHPGNLQRTPDGQLAILDFGLMSRIDENIKYGMIEAISHLIHRDYEAIVEDFVTLEFIPPGTDLSPILPVLAKVFDQALQGGGAKSINFQDLAADLAQITFDYPFQIPPYFALIIRAISVLEGIALKANPEFAIVDEAYPYIAQRLLVDNSPRLREALRYMVYGKNKVFDADRLIDLLQAFEVFSEASQQGQGGLDGLALNSGATTGPTAKNSQQLAHTSSSSASPVLVGQQPTNGRAMPPVAQPTNGRVAPGGDRKVTSVRPARLPSSGAASNGAGRSQQPFPFPMPAFAGGLPAQLFGGPSSPIMQLLGLSSQPAPAAPSGMPAAASQDAKAAREALKFMFSPKGVFFREFLMDELVKSIDALSREQLRALLLRSGLQGARIPNLLPGSARQFLPLDPDFTADDQKVIDNVTKIANFLAGGNASMLFSGTDPQALFKHSPGVEQ
ncbi:hypothetical protein WJX84_006967 [Apatococcus fuscideae]|uniref:ABC1 atypical kinase-like domain-containing protein n=1 Tax=Apatococcus fuscideae TaxID=2026836 RepID=A0AAW1TBL8_9CHLO